MSIVAEDEIVKQIKLCADQGWKANFYFTDGKIFKERYITGADYDKKAIVVERIGQRGEEPDLIFFKDLKKVEADWT